MADDQTQVGWNLVEIESGDIVEQWRGSAWGEVPGFPNPLILPDGMQVCGGMPDTDYHGYQVVAWREPNSNAPVPLVSQRQFYQECAIQDWITEDEAFAAIQTKTIPAAILTAIETLPPADQFSAKMQLVGNLVYDRANPFFDVIGNSFGKTPEEVTALFRAAALL